MKKGYRVYLLLYLHFHCWQHVEERVNKQEGQQEEHRKVQKQ